MTHCPEPPNGSIQNRHPGHAPGGYEDAVLLTGSPVGTPQEGPAPPAPSTSPVSDTNPTTDPGIHRSGDRPGQPGESLSGATAP